MNIKVKSCGDCPFRDVYTCLNPKGKYKLTIYNYYIDNTTHPSCPLRTEKITVELGNTVTLPQDESSE